MRAKSPRPLTVFLSHAPCTESGRRTRVSLLSGDPYTPSNDAPCSGGDGGNCEVLAQRRKPTDEGRRLQEATVGFEPTHEGFADPCLTTWRRRRKKPSAFSCQLISQTSAQATWLMADG